LDNDGVITTKELSESLSRLPLQLAREDIDLIVELADKDKNMKVDY